MKKAAIFVFMAIYCSLFFVYLAPASSQKKERFQWITLGNVQVDNFGFAHVFKIRPNKGAFSRLKFTITGELKLDLIIVQFEKGGPWSPKEYPRLPLKTTSYVVELPDGEKVLKSVEFRYHDVRSPIDRAVVELYGGRVKENK